MLPFYSAALLLITLYLPKHVPDNMYQFWCGVLCINYCAWVYSGWVQGSPKKTKNPVGTFCPRCEIIPAHCSPVIFLPRSRIKNKSVCQRWINKCSFSFLALWFSLIPNRESILEPREREFWGTDSSNRNVDCLESIPRISDRYLEESIPRI